MHDFNLLDEELSRWREAGLTVPIWWRDDDAVRPTAALDRLGELSQETGLDVHLAVIPAGVTPELATCLAQKPQFHPVVHGWAHTNHAPGGEKKAEFGTHRPPARLRGDAARGLETLEMALHAPPVAMFVPPWNRIAPDLVGALGGLGYGMLSTFGPRAAPMPAPDLMQINTHIDPISWRADRGLVDPAQQINALVTHLGERRAGRADADEPLGVLTHHLVHDEAIWTFVRHLILALMRGPVRPWTAARTITRKEPLI